MVALFHFYRPFPKVLFRKTELKERPMSKGKHKETSLGTLINKRSLLIIHYKLHKKSEEHILKHKFYKAKKIVVFSKEEYTI